MYNQILPSQLKIMWKIDLGLDSAPTNKGTGDLLVLTRASHPSIFYCASNNRMINVQCSYNLIIILNFVAIIIIVT